MQANGREADWGVSFDAKGSPEVKVALRPDAPFDHESPVDRDRTQRHSCACHQGLKEHVARAGETAVAAGRRMQSCLHHRLTGCYGA